MMEDGQPKQEIEQEEKQKVIHGGRNLILLGIGSIVHARAILLRAKSATMRMIVRKTFQMRVR